MSGWREAADQDTIRHLEAQLAEKVQQLRQAEQQAAALRKQRDALITQLTQPPHNHTYQAIAEAAGITRQAVGWIRAKQQ